MTEKEKIEILLKPRYKVIALWPGTDYDLGNIVFDPSPANQKNFFFFDNYPHLFQPLSWWQEREVGEMPEYMKCVLTPDQDIMPEQVLKMTWNEICGKDENNRVVIVSTNCFLPATEADYLNYINSKQK